ncbi:MAG: hypothetical protein LQ351_002508 [Letrouitia transgressa]|nr:MAG: hypothetical protein LQ351_002508 [Letrouitia transgressa]
MLGKARKKKSLLETHSLQGHTHLLRAYSLPLSVSNFNSQLANYHHLFNASQPLPGALTLLEKLTHATPPPSLALASSSSKSLFTTKASHLPNLLSAFPTELRIFGDDPDMQGKTGKPAPHIFLLALRRINAYLATRSTTLTQESTSLSRPVLPNECLVFEDSIAGITAARAAGMYGIWVPHAGLRAVCRGWEREVLNGNGMQALQDRKVGESTKSSSSEAEGGNGDEEQGKNKCVSEDGRAEMLWTLEVFDLERYNVVSGKQ